MAQISVKRTSNLELFRIISMLSIVASHFVINSNMIWGGEKLYGQIESNTIFLLLFGMAGKIGINCFVMITGYFMCKSNITLRKFVKLLGQIYFYNILIYLILFYFGKVELSAWRLKDVLFPFWGITNGFVSCFLVFWLTIPFWNILIHHMSQKQHLYLLSLLLFFYSLLGSIPFREGFPLSLNYVSWFGVIYLIGSYVRFYPNSYFRKGKLWGVLSIISLVLAYLSIVWLHKTKGWNEFFYVMDSNKILAVFVSVSAFMWFKNLKINYNKWINIIGGATFGVLLIHANCEEVRTILWYDIFDCIHKYNLPAGKLVLFSITSVSLVFGVCVIFELLRQKTVEKVIFKWFDRKFDKI